MVVRGVHIFVSGRVQGVSFRSYTRSCAHKLGLKGWVQNLDDGRVEIVAQGEEKKVDDFLEMVSRGSSYSRVDGVMVSDLSSVGDFLDFEIR